MFYIAISKLGARYDTKKDEKSYYTQLSQQKINKEINYSSKSGPEKYSKRHDSG